jgi:hypothetical protein
MTSGEAAFLQPGGSGVPAAIIEAERLPRNRSPSFTRMVAKERPRVFYVIDI